MTTFYDEVQQIKAQYPQERSAVLPALRLAQERHGGWLPPEALPEVAEALELTPAQVEAVASFYDMLHLEPVGKHLVEVCTNLSCALVGAQQVLEAFEREVGVAPGETSEDGEFTLRAIECAGGCGWAVVVAVDAGYVEPVKPGDVPGIVEGCAVGIDEIALAHADERDLTQLAEYEAIGGYEALRKARGMEPEKIVEELMNANLRGRGGAGFPMGRKASFLAKGTGKPTYLCVNADESEPGTFKDREIMLKNPHRLIEGCLVTAHGIESKNVFIYLRGEYLDVFEVMRGALEQTRAAGLLEDVTIVLHRGAGAYICGEESALLESLEGKRGQPRSRPPFPAVSGLYGSPTLINNVQTVATVPPDHPERRRVVRGDRPRDLARHRRLLVSGNIVNPGNYELELGTPMRELIYDLGGGIPDGRELKAIIPGGSSTTVMTPDLIDTPLDYNSVAEVGSQFGAAALIVIDDRACMVQLALRSTQFYMHESCGKCTPCREGTRWMVQLLHALEAGQADQAQLDLLVNVADRIMGRCLCALGDFAAGPVLEYARTFREEFQRHIDEGGCPFGGESSLEGIFAPVDQHHGHPTAEVPS